MTYSAIKNCKFSCIWINIWETYCKALRWVICMRKHVYTVRHNDWFTSHAGYTRAEYSRGGTGWPTETHENACFDVNRAKAHLCHTICSPKALFFLSDPLVWAVNCCLIKINNFSFDDNKLFWTYYAPPLFSLREDKEICIDSLLYLSTKTHPHKPALRTHGVPLSVVAILVNTVNILSTIAFTRIFVPCMLYRCYPVSAYTYNETWKQSAKANIEYETTFCITLKKVCAPKITLHWIPLIFVIRVILCQYYAIL